MNATGAPKNVTELHYLPVILRRIENGEIRVPAFQRGFIWNDRRIIELLRSVYQGYPIGSIILWNTSDRSLGAKFDDGIPFPSSQVHFPITYVIDGVQRLSTLYGALGDLTNQEQDPRFAVAFDLRKGDFRKIKTKNLLKPHEILLSVLFSPRLFFAAQQSFLEHEDRDFLIERSMQLYDVFSRYQIPLVIIGDHDLSEVFEIFRKLNTQGMPLKRSQLDRKYRW